MALIVWILRDVPDPRLGNARRHDLVDILTIALVGSVCGCDSCVDFADFAGDREGLLREFPSLETGLPSHDAFSGVFRFPVPGGVCGLPGALRGGARDGRGGDGGDRRQDLAAVFRPGGVGVGLACGHGIRDRPPSPASNGCASAAPEPRASLTYYLCSVPISAERVARAARAHWRIENGWRRVLDMAFDEDRPGNRKDNGPENLATLRKLAPNRL